MAQAGSEFWASLLAGGCTGLFVDAVLFPLDVFKTRKQAETSCRRQTTSSASSALPQTASSAVANTTAGHASAGAVSEARTSRASAGASAHASPASGPCNTPASAATSFARSGAVAAESPARPGHALSSSSLSLPGSHQRDSGASASSSRSQTGKDSFSVGSARGPDSVSSSRNTARALSSSSVGMRTALDVASNATGLNGLVKSSETNLADNGRLRAEGRSPCRESPKPSTRFSLSGLIGGKEHFGFLGSFARRYYPGFGALAAGAFPSSALFFVTYEGSKQFLAEQEAGRQLSPAVTYGVCSTLAEFASCCVRTPFEMLKQQMQLGMHATTTKAIQAIWQRDGWRGFFVGFNATIVRDLPFVGVEMGLWEHLKKYFCSFPGVSESAALTSFSSGLAGFLAGAGAAVATTPLDVVKTRLMTQQEGRYQYRGYFDCFSTILQREGYAALFRGLKIRVIWVALGGALFLGGYDGFKALYLRVLPGRWNVRAPDANNLLKNGVFWTVLPVKSVAKSLMEQENRLSHLP